MGRARRFSRITGRTGNPDAIRPASHDPTREQTCFFFPLLTLSTLASSSLSPDLGWHSRTRDENGGGFGFCELESEEGLELERWTLMMKLKWGLAYDSSWEWRMEVEADFVSGIPGIPGCCSGFEGGLKIEQRGPGERWQWAWNRNRMWNGTRDWKEKRE